MNQDFKYWELTQRIIGCAMRVHNSLGGGNFTENIFHRALLIEFLGEGMAYESEKEFSIFYKDQFIGKKRADILIEGKVLVELKCVGQMETIHFNQLINYLKIFDIEVGLLINFGKQSLEFKRFVNKKKSSNYNPRNPL